jgi:hypothetical protein
VEVEVIEDDSVILFIVRVGVKESFNDILSFGVAV